MGRCPRCGGRRFRKAPRTLSAVFPASRVRASLTVTGRQCTRCHDTHVPAPVAQGFDLAVARELADQGVHTGEAVRHMRRSLGLRAADLAALLAVTPETISHWETGKVRVNRAAFVALAAMVEDAIAGRTLTRDRLAALDGARASPRVLSPRLP